MKKIVLIIVLTAAFMQTRAEEIRSAASGSAFNAATWVGDGRANITCSASSAIVTGALLDSLRIGDALAVPVTGLIGIVQSIESAASLTLAANASAGYGPGPFTFYRQPAVTDNVTIMAAHTVDASTADGMTGLTAHDVTIDGTFITNLIDMNIAGNLTVNTGGVFTQNRPSRVIMDDANASIGGTAASIRIRSLRVKTTNVPAHLTLLKPVVAAETLDVENATIDLNGQTLTVGTGIDTLAGTVLAKGTYRIINGPGTMTRWINAAAITIPDTKAIFPLFAAGVNRNVWFGGTFTAGGTISVTYTGGTGTTPIAYTDAAAALTVDKRTNEHWDITSTGLAGTGPAMTIQASGLPGISSVSDLTLSDAAANAGGIYAATGGTPADPKLNRTFANAAALAGAYYIASSAGSPMPVELTSFAAGAKGRAIVLQWNTAAEKNNYGFDIERRAAGSAAAASAYGWTKIGFAEGHGTTNSPHSYSFADTTATGSFSYRLKQIDRDGRCAYSSAVEATAAQTATTYLLTQNYPNPFNPATTIHFMLTSTRHAAVTVYNALGQEIATLFDGAAEGGIMHTVVFDASGLSSGMYVYTLRSGDQREVRKMQLLR